MNFEGKKGQRMELRVSRDWIKQLDLWRGKQIGCPSRAASVRYLVAKGTEPGEDDATKTLQG